MTCTAMSILSRWRYLLRYASSVQACLERSHTVLEYRLCVTNSIESEVILCYRTPCHNLDERESQRDIALPDEGDEVKGG